MRLADREWLLYCRQCGEWTGLHRFMPGRGHFQGEHSLTMNAYLNSDLLLGKFLMHHADHEVLAIPDASDDYTQIKVQRDRFLEGMIDTMVEDRIQREQDQEANQEARRKEGYHTLLTLRGLYDDRLRQLESHQPDDPAQARVHLGKSLGVQWCREQIDFLIDFRKQM